MVTESPPLVLLVEDEPQMRRFLRASLTSHGYRLLEAATVQEGERLVTTHSPEVVLLDLGLPDGDGLDLAKRIREWSRVPIIVLSARGREEEKVEALDAGADDYLTKPFGVRELLARVRVALRHSAGTAASADGVIQAGPLRVALASRVVEVAGRQVHLTRTEYRLLALLAQNLGRVLTHRQLLTEVWGPDAAGQTHYVRVRVAELRKKIETDPTRPRLLVTEQGVGYRLISETTPSEPDR
jgi:two-component system, OmpR family, KDP operon response regulator KdpE